MADLREMIRALTPNVPLPVGINTATSAMGIDAAGDVLVYVPPNVEEFQAEGAPFLSLSGGTMLGSLILAHDPVQPLEAATRQYVDGTIARAGGPFLSLAGGGTVTGPLNWTATGAITSRSAQDRSADIRNVRDFGAVGNGVANDTTAIQAALDAAGATGGGTVYLPAGTYLISATLLVSSNTRVHGDGVATHVLASAMISPSPTGRYDIFANRNWNVSALTDHDITIENMFLDFGTGVIGTPGTASCAVRMQYVTRVIVRNVRLDAGDITTGPYVANNGTAMVGCRDTWTIDCQAYNFGNCCYDHWEGPQNAWLLGCYAESPLFGQMVNFNPEATIPGGTWTATGFVMANNQIRFTGGLAAPCQIESLAGPNVVSEVVITNNTFFNVYLSMRGALSGAVISNNVFDTMTRGTEVIRAFTQNGGSPSSIVVSDNTIINPATTAANGGVIRIYTSSAAITGNTIIGTLAAPAIDVSTFTPVVLGNSVSGAVTGNPSLGTGGTLNGPLTVTGTLTASGVAALNNGLTVNNGSLLNNGIFCGTNYAAGIGDLTRHFNLYSNTVGINITSDNNVNYMGPAAHVFYAAGTPCGFFSSTGITLTGAAGAVRIGGGAGPSWTSGVAVPTATEPVGSLYSQTGGAVGATLYVSRGGGTWAAVAGV